MIKYIDLVVPYVDAMDKQWRALYEQYASKEANPEVNTLQRFRGQGDFFRYFFRCVAKNMPFIRNLFLVVQSDSQVPSWVNRNTVTIIKHEDFMPKDLLPVFNSTAIEMFIPFIPGLSEFFIYANDDLLPVGEMKDSFFFQENKVKTSARLCGDLKSMYGHHIVNSFSLIYGQYREEDRCPGFSHIMRPLLKSKCLECFNKYSDKILASVTPFRSTINYNIYIYDHYMMKTNNYLARTDLKMTSITARLPNDSLKDILNSKIFNSLNICDNNDDVDIYENNILHAYFASNYPTKCKYER